ncbi:VanZ family protein [Salisediminibacterium halotolerans]|uniref:VanZ family protein n=1 Tax=Salisediminibacterium halotolerans TaxID=517425 RepID=UPI000EB570D0|nr:VanZ family protein [Salisediminibacterium halotolerans]RLJ74113.1 glycopeptide antibiotics resistance protein [Actinophytocola xinjiangensis]RPE87793.1 glycopeptide antibiotics resistance protein [Salisediminibacterium halotolerans]TWG34950.1 glycopeptide antibiotics resistance protein [Salisediminibacterium halotolerans]GEL08216.1 hypothetical protein SHA02_16320 [Salisediminibacterium halotolerans]
MAKKTQLKKKQPRKKGNSNGRSRLRWLWAAGLFIYLAGLFYITLFAWNHGSSYGNLGPGGRNYNLEPFLSIYNILTFSDGPQDPLRILAGNVVLFLPFGFLLSASIESFRRNRKRYSLLSAVVMSAVVSTIIEVNQFLFTYRVANIDDVILNTAGGLLGALLYRFFSRKKGKNKKSKRK